MHFNSSGDSFLKKQYVAQEIRQSVPATFGRNVSKASSSEKSVFNSTSQQSIWSSKLSRSLSSVSPEFKSPHSVSSQAWNESVDESKRKELPDLRCIGGIGNFCCCSSLKAFLLGLTISSLIAGIILAVILTMWLKSSTTTKMPTTVIATGTSPSTVTTTTTTTTATTATTTTTVTTTTTITTATTATTTTTVTTTTTATTATTATTTTTTTTVTTTTTITTATTATTTTTVTTTTTITTTTTAALFGPGSCSSGVCSSGETLLDFETGGSIPAGYGNFTWTNLNDLNGATYNPLSGYHVVTCSGSYVAFSSNTITMKTMTNGTTFTLNSFLATAAWYDNLNLTINGLVSGTSIYTTSLLLQVFSITLVNLNWSGIDTLTLMPSGGTHNANVTGNGEHVAIDNMCVTY